MLLTLVLLQHHETTQAFIRALEFLAPSAQSVEAMRTHIVYTSFERRWQLPVYFQLRWKEIVTKVEEALTTTKLERSTSKGSIACPHHAVVEFCSLKCPQLSRRS